MIRAYNGVIGGGISKETHERLESEQRPSEVLNFLLPMTNTISGMISGNKLAIKANPLRKGDEKSALFRTVLVSDYAIGQKGYEEMAASHTDAAICGRGVVNNYYSTQLRRWVVEAFDPFMVMGDPDADPQNESKERYKFVSAYYSVDEILNIFDLDPEIADAIKKAAKDTEGTSNNIKSSKWAQRIFGGAADTIPNADKYGNLMNSMIDLRNGLYRVIEFHDKRQIETGYLFNPQSGDVFSVDQEVSSDPQKKSELLQAYPQTQGWLYQTDKKDEIWTIAICPTLSPSKTLINKKHPIQGKGFQHKSTYWYSYHPDKMEARGVLDNLLSLNDYFSKLKMTQLDAVLRGVFPDVTYEDGTLTDAQLTEWKSKEVGKMKPYKKGMNKPEREKIMEEVISSLGGLSSDFFELRNELSGIPKASQGFQDSSKETGILYRQKVQMGAISTETPNSHIRRNMVNDFNYCSEGLRVFMTLPEQVRILSEPPEGLEGVEMDQTTQDAYWLKLNWQDVGRTINDVTAGEYDFVADMTQLGQTGRMAQEAASMDYLNLAAKIMPEAAAAMLPKILEESELPIGKDLAKIIKPLIDIKLGVQQNAAQKQIVGSDLALANTAEQTMNPQQQPQPTEQPQ
jgi:hypothetical protein